MEADGGELGRSHGRRRWLDGSNGGVVLHSSGIVGRRTRRGGLGKDMARRRRSWRRGIWRVGRESTTKGMKTTRRRNRRKARPRSLRVRDQG